MCRRALRWLHRAFDEDSEIKEASWDRVGPRQDGDWVAQAEIAAMTDDQRLDDIDDSRRHD